MVKAHNRMIVTHAPADVQSAAAIFFLLTSYFAAIRSHGGAAILPAALLYVRLRGEADGACRYAEAVALRRRFVRPSGPAPALASEPGDIPGAAPQRLPASQTATKQRACDRGASPFHDDSRRTPTC